MANRTSGAFTATGASDAVSFDEGQMSLSGTFVATVDLQVSHDGGTNWHDVDGENHTGATDKIVEAGAEDTLYRWNCSVFTSGPVAYFLGGLRTD